MNKKKFLYFISLLIAPIVLLAQTTDFQRARERMVKEQIELRGVKDPLVLNAMRKVERHRFVPENLQPFAYADRPLPIGYDQTISQPYIVAIMTELVEPKNGQTVLEIGTGSGYQAAVLAEIVSKVYTIEIVPELVAISANRLKRLGYKNVKVKKGDGFFGWEEAGPFDGIIVTAAPLDIPSPLVSQLKAGGRMVIPVGTQGGVQNLMVIEKKIDGSIRKKTVMPVRFVPFTREPE